MKESSEECRVMKLDTYLDEALAHDLSHIIVRQLRPVGRVGAHLAKTFRVVARFHGFGFEKKEGLREGVLKLR